MGSPPPRVSLIEVVQLSVYLPRNARALMRGAAAGRPDQVPVARRDRGPQPGLQPLFGRDLARTWEYWANKAGCGHLLTRPDSGHAHPQKG